MPKHVYLILVPADPDGIRRALAPVYRQYAGHIHTRPKRTGHFWRGRFGCVAIDEEHLTAAARYVALNPVRAGLVKRATDWRWSSARAHSGNGADDRLTHAAPIKERFPDFAALLASGETDECIARLRKAETIGRPIGNAVFMDSLEAASGRVLRQAKRGRRPKLSELSP
jgi:putative transposase